MLSFSRNTKLTLRRETVATLSSVALDAVMGGAAGAVEAPNALAVPKLPDAQVSGGLGNVLAPRRLGTCFCTIQP